MSDGRDAFPEFKANGAASVELAIKPAPSQMVRGAGLSAARIEEHAVIKNVAEMTTTQDSMRTIDALPARVRTIATLRGLGYSFREIGRQFDVTPQAASVMLSRHRRSLEHLKGSVELHGLSARAVNALGRLGVSSRDDAGRVNIMGLLGKERNCGSKTLDEIRRWLTQEQSAFEGRSLLLNGSHQNCA